MPNIANLLKAEITRLARKEAKREVASLRKTNAALRSQVAALRKSVAELSKKISRASRQRPAATQARDEPASEGRRFSAKGLAAQRRRLGLSAAELGRLIGSSAQSVYNWEGGKARPRAAHLQSLVQLRGLGKRAIAERLAEGS